MPTRPARKGDGAEFVRFFGPLLEALRELGGSATPSEVVEQIVRALEIPENVQNELLKSGTPKLSNQIAWAREYLKREGLIDASKRGIWSLTEKGRSTHLSPEDSRALFQKLARIRHEETKKRKEQEAEGGTEPADGAGTEAIDYRDRLLEVLMTLPPAGFERLCQRLLREAFGARGK